MFVELEYDFFVDARLAVCALRFHTHRGPDGLFVQNSSLCFGWSSKNIAKIVYIEKLFCGLT